MSERDDLEELLTETRERHARALEQELDRRMSRLWRAPEHRLERQLLKPALALASVALLFLGAWLYDLSQPGGEGLIVLDARYERPKVVLREPGDPVRLTQQIAGVPEQEPTLRLVEPGPLTGVFRAPEEMLVPAGLSDSAGNWFFIMDSKIVKVTPEGGSSVIAENLDKPGSLAFDSEGGLLVLESGKGRILRVEPKDDEIQAGSPVSVFAEGFASAAREPKDIAAMHESKPERLTLELAPEERVGPVYLAVSKSGEIFVGGRAENGEAVVYKIARKKFKWWKFYCLYRC